MASTPPPRIAVRVSSHSCRRARNSLSSAESRFTSAPLSVLFCFGAAIRCNWDSELMQDVSRILADANKSATRWWLDLDQAGSGDDVVLARHSRLLIKVDHFKLAASFR